MSRRPWHPLRPAAAAILSISLVAILGGLTWYFSSRSSPSRGVDHPPPGNPAEAVTPAPLNAPPGTNRTISHSAQSPVELPARPPEAAPPTVTNLPSPPLVKSNPPPDSTAIPAPVQQTHSDIPGAGWTDQTPPVTNALLAQIALAERGISTGSIDGNGGAQTAAGLRAFQMDRGLEITGRLDPATVRALTLRRPPFTHRILSSEDLARLRPVPSGWEQKAAAERLDYATALELVSESVHTHPAALKRWNSGIDWEHPVPGMVLLAPVTDYPPARRAALLRVNLSGHWLRAFDERGNLLAHFPCSIGRIAEKRPVGLLHVTTVARNPNYTFNPEVFPESPEARAIGHKLVLPPGPNNPVGIAWIGLDRPGYGIHGTPNPEEVGRTESHGCFRLANWNADYLRQMVRVGTPVSVEP